jgi:type IV secretion system protein TrbG
MNDTFLTMRNDQENIFTVSKCKCKCSRAGMMLLGLVAYLGLSCIISGCTAKHYDYLEGYNYKIAVNEAGVAGAERPMAMSYNSNGKMAAARAPVLTAKKSIFKYRSGAAEKNAVEGEDAVKTANTKALHKPKSTRYANSTMIFDFVSGALYQIYCAPLRVTDVQFQANEHVVSVGAGDTLRWQVSKTYSGAGGTRQEHLLVKPIDAGLTNSVVVTTDIRTYHLMFTSTSDTYIASVAWHYADSENGSLMNVGDGPGGMGGGATDTDVMSTLDINSLDFRFAVSVAEGPRPDWYPAAVFHDGRKTYIKFASSMQEAPTLFVGNSVKNNQMVNYRVVGNYYVIDGLFPFAQLRSGQNKQIVVQIVYKGT